MSCSISGCGWLRRAVRPCGPPIYSKPAPGRLQLTEVGAAVPSLFKSSAAGPGRRSHRSAARSRGGRWTAPWPFCSTMNTVTPFRLMSWISWKFRWTRAGERPIDGSSMSRSRGRDMSARHREHLLLAASRASPPAGRAAREAAGTAPARAPGGARTAGRSVRGRRPSPGSRGWSCGEHTAILRHERRGPSRSAAVRASLINSPSNPRCRVGRTAPGWSSWSSTCPRRSCRAGRRSRPRRPPDSRRANRMGRNGVDLTESEHPSPPSPGSLDDRRMAGDVLVVLAIQFP